MKEKYNDADGKPCTKQEWLEAQGLTLEDQLEWEQDQRIEAQILEEAERVNNG